MINISVQLQLLFLLVCSSLCSQAQEKSLLSDRSTTLSVKPAMKIEGRKIVALQYEPRSSFDTDKINTNASAALAALNDASGNEPANAAAALPFSSFNATKNGCGIDLNWSLARNFPIASISVERSNNGEAFESIAQLPVQSNNTYTYKDEKLKNGMYLYRIRIALKNEPDFYSDAISTNLSCNQGNSIVLFPNPGKDLVNIQSSDNICKICIFTATGQRVETKRSLPNTNTLLDVKELANGVYILEITTENRSKQNLKFIKD